MTRHILRYGYKVTKRIIPTSVNSICMLRNHKLRRFVIPYIISNLIPNRSPLKDEEPWITFEAKEWLKDYLTCNMMVFEYGSGGSTIFFSKRVKKLISVEHDRVWYQRVLDILKDNTISNCKYILSEPQRFADNQSEFTEPLTFTSCEHPNMSFEAYAKSIESFPDKSFDLIFIDGRARVSCIRCALDKVRPNGFLVLDNSEREYYLSGMELLADWKRIDFFGPGLYGCNFWQTSIWERQEDKNGKNEELLI